MLTLFTLISCALQTRKRKLTGKDARLAAFLIGGELLTVAVTITAVTYL